MNRPPARALLVVGLLLLALLILLGLAFCGRPGPGPAPSPTATATRPPTQTPAPATATPSATATRPPTQTPAPATATPAIRIILEGYISKYGPGVFEASIAHQEAQGWHDYPDDLAQFAGFLALADCDRKGQVVYARPGPAQPWQPFLVADCAGDDQTRQWMVANRIVAEADHQTWVEWRPRYVTRKGIPIQIGVIDQ